MASEKILNDKKILVKEIVEKINKSNTFLIFDYTGLSVKDVDTLRNKLREDGTELKVYKNTMVDLALKDAGVSLNEYMNGPNAFLFSENLLEPIKTISDFAKDHPTLKIRAGYINKELASLDLINDYASIPSMEGLLTMFASGLIEHLRNFSIGLNLYAEKLEGGEK